ncbi:MAG: D-alanyl-D-alanine carboxypeptidase [Enhydrobacter sp.]|nr:MAG: D-alanyl-D-alanine carboxypeptidase [Enhydrobacter sp.]
MTTALPAVSQPVEIHAQAQKPGTRPAAKPAAPPAAKPEPPPSLSQIGITTPARQAYMVDPITGTVLLYKDAEAPMAPSSMSKMMTVYLLFEEITAGRISLDTKFRVSERAWRMGGSRMFLELGSEVTVEELIRGIIVLSGNDACVVVAEGLSGTEENFADLMTRRGRELGMTNSIFRNSSGWPAEGQHTTARDLAVLSWRTIEDFPKLYRYYAEQQWTYNRIRQENRNRLLRTTPGTDGLKTGHTEEAGYGQTTSTVREGRRLVLVVNGLGSMAERAQETARLIEWGFREFTNTTVFRAGDVLAEAPVWLGTRGTVPLVISRTIQLTLPAGQSYQPRAVARFEGPLPAPIAKGTKLGTAAVTMPDGRTVEYPLEAGADVPREGLFGRTTTLLRHYLFGWWS